MAGEYKEVFLNACERSLMTEFLRLGVFVCCLWLPSVSLIFLEELKNDGDRMGWDGQGSGKGGVEFQSIPSDSPNQVASATSNIEMSLKLHTFN